MASELVKVATSSKLKEVDWAKDVEICELVARDEVYAKDVVKAIKKQLLRKRSNSQLYAVVLLEMLMNNAGDIIHQEVMNADVLPVLVKMVKKKSIVPVRERVFLLLDAMQTAFGGACGRYPQYYAAYYELVCAQVQFSHRADIQSRKILSVSAGSNKIFGKQKRNESAAAKPASQISSEASIISEVAAAMEVLKDVLSSVDTRNAAAAKDEVTLDLVEQCSFHKQRVMHIVLSSMDNELVSKALMLNDKLGELLAKHDELISEKQTPVGSYLDEIGEEEESDQLKRLNKGKSCVNEQRKQMATSKLPLSVGSIHSPVSSPDGRQMEGAPSFLPPPPARHTEREKYFKDNHSVVAHFRNLSLDSCSGGSSSSSAAGSFK